MAQKGADIYLLLDLDGQGNRDLERARIPSILAAVANALSPQIVSDVESVPHARIPLLRGQCSSLRFDLTVGTYCGLWNTSLLRRYAMQDPGRVLPLCIIVSMWSKRRGINDSPNGLLSTYSVMLMVVFFLQTAGLLPVLDLEEIAGTTVCNDMPPLLSSTELESAELGRLLVEFFAFAAGFQWDALVMSVRCGVPLWRTQKPRFWQVHPLCVEDPFETHLNTCRRVNPRGHRVVLAAFGTALRFLLSGHDILGLVGDERTSRKGDG